MPGMNVSKWREKSPRGLDSMQTTIGNGGKLGMGEVSLPKGEHTNYCLILNGQHLKHTYN